VQPATSPIDSAPAEVRVGRGADGHDRSRAEERAARLGRSTGRVPCRWAVVVVTRVEEQPGASTAEDAPTEHAPASARGGARGRARLAPHVVAYLILLLLVAWRTDLDVPWMSDDGAYGAQVVLIRDGGSWAVESAPTWGTDPSVRATFGKSTVTADGEFPYVKHPAWISALSVADRVGLPVVGAYVLAVAAAIAAAFVAGRLATGTRWAAPLAFWAVALGPPLVWSSNLWAHAPAAALGAVTALAAVRWWASRSWWWAVALVGAPAVLGLLRSEGLLLGVAAGVVVALRMWRDRADRPSVVAGVATGGALGIGLVASRLVDRAWADHVAPGADITVPASHGPWLGGRITGAEATFLSGGLVQPGRMLGLLAMVLLAVGTLLVLRPSVRRIGALVLVAGLASYALRVLSQPDDLLLGLLPAVPLLAVGLIAVPDVRGDDRLRVLAVLSGTYLGLVLLTQYPDGGAMDWGGRFTAPALVALVVLAVAGVERLSTVVPADARRITAAGVALLVVLPVVPALVATNGFRARHGEIVRAVEQTGAPVAIATERAAPLIAWSTTDRVAWTVTGDEGLLPLLARARAAGEDDLVVVGRWIDDEELIAAGWRVERLTPAVAHVTRPMAPDAGAASGSVSAGGPP
jgi:hypothetical protein